MPLQITRQEGNKLSVCLVDLSGETNILYVPLAIMSLKANLLAVPQLADNVDVHLLGFTQKLTTAEMLHQILDTKPDVLGVSCQGWNYRQIASLLPSIRQFQPETVIVLGGNHVSNRGDLLLRILPSVDLIVNGEGELTLNELMLHFVAGAPALADINGISYWADNKIVTTPARPKTRKMMELASPYGLEDVDWSRYDIALLETNRGCPYHCAFCYWGGRVGQKLAKGELDRVLDELETIGKAGIETVFLCDANFGILPQDIAVAEKVVEIHKKYGAPREFNVNWAKNHAARVGEIIRILDEGGVNTAINIPVQTLSKKAFELADRTEAGRAAMLKEAEGLVRKGRYMHCELIFGMPGESLADFKENYNKLFLMFPNLRIHPLWILPNTTYDQKREAFALRTISPDASSDYEAVLSHREMSMQDMNDGLTMLLAHSILNLLGSARTAMKAYARLAGGDISQALADLEGFLAEGTTQLDRDFYKLFQRIRKASYFERSLRARKRKLLYAYRPATLDMVRRFILTRNMSEPVEKLCLELASYDCSLLPRGDLAGDGFTDSEYAFNFNPPAVARMLEIPDSVTLDDIYQTPATKLVVRHKAGLAKLDGSNCDLTGAWNGRVQDSTTVDQDNVSFVPAGESLALS